MGFNYGSNCLQIKKVLYWGLCFTEKVRINIKPCSLGDPSRLKANLKVMIGAAKKRNEPIEHLLLHGPSGLGKTTLSYLIAKELGTNIRVTSGTALEKAGDVGSILTGLADGDVLFIDEVHRLNK